MSVLQTPVLRAARLRSGAGRGCVVLGLTALLAGGLTGCSGGEAKPPAASSSPTSPAADPIMESPSPTGPPLTEPGSILEFGTPAEVAMSGNKGEGVLKVTVVALQKAPWRLFEGWKVGKKLRAHQPYFVQVKVRNAGDVGLGRLPVPLQVLDVQDRLVESSTFADTFKPCPSTELPAKFKPGAKTTGCLVFLVPDGAEVAAVAYRAGAETDLVRWIGPTTKWQQPGKNAKKSKKSQTEKSKADGAE